MNKFEGIGTLPRDGVLNGTEKKVLRFTLATVIGRSKKTNKDRLAFVPCVVFNPAEVIVNMLAENTKGKLISLEGLVNTSKFKGKDGQTKYSTEVVVNQPSIRSFDNPATAEDIPFGSETPDSEVGAT